MHNNLSVILIKLQENTRTRMLGGDYKNQFAHFAFAHFAKQMQYLFNNALKYNNLWIVNNNIGQNGQKQIGQIHFKKPK